MTPGTTVDPPAQTRRPVREKTPRPLTEREPLVAAGPVALYLDQSEKTLEAWRARGFGPRFIRVGQGVRYRWSDIDAWLDLNTIEPEVAA
jgi:hypothetical protein